MVINFWALMTIYHLKNLLRDSRSGQRTPQHHQAGDTWDTTNVVLALDGIPKTEDGSQTMGELIMQMRFHIAMAAIRAGVSLNRWQNSTTAMFEKTPGVTRINKLRVIHLYEADYNSLLKLLWAESGYGMPMLQAD
jgi:hypothetical protein